MKNPIDVLIEYLQEYESDTFSVGLSGLMPSEAKRLAKFFIARDFHKITDGIDGLQIREVLGWLRKGELKAKDFKIKL